MANDGLLFVCFRCLDESSHAMEIMTLVGGFLSGCLAALFTTEPLVCTLFVITDCSFIYYTASSVSGQDEPNPAL